MFVQTVVVSLLALLLGLTLCFAGFRFFVTLLPLWAFFAGFIVTAQTIQELFSVGFLASISGWVFGLLIGVGCALVAYFSYYAAVVVLAASVGFEFGVGILSGFGVSASFLLFLAGLIVAVAVVAAVIYLDLPKTLIVGLTAVIGASLILTGILLALGRVSLPELAWGVVGDVIRSSWLWLPVLIVLAAAGVIVQLRLPEVDTLASPTQQQAPA